MKEATIVIPGGSGFLGQSFAKHCLEKKINPVILTRNPQSVRYGRPVFWDGKTLGPWVSEIEGAQAVLNLAGRSVNCRYHRKNREAILQSRIESTRVLGDAISQCQRPPAVWLNSSTATIYRHSLDTAWDEQGEIGATAEARDSFSVEVARQWELTLNRAPVPSATRKLNLRTALVLGPQPGGVYHVLRRLVQLCLGGKMASGHQFVSWIHIDDFCRAIDWLIDHENASGTYNLSSPHPVTNSEMMAILRRRLGKRFGLPAPCPLLEIGAWLFRTESELVIKSRRVVPGRLIAEGFHFEFPSFCPAIERIERNLNHQPHIQKP